MFPFGSRQAATRSANGFSLGKSAFADLPEDIALAVELHGLVAVCQVDHDVSAGEFNRRERPFSAGRPPSESRSVLIERTLRRWTILFHLKRQQMRDQVVPFPPACGPCWSACGHCRSRLKRAVDGRLSRPGVHFQSRGLGPSSVIKRRPLGSRLNRAISLFLGESL